MALGDFKSDIDAFLSSSPISTFVSAENRAKALKAIDDLETTVRADAGTGATAAVKPMVIASIVVGGVAALLAATALIVAFRRSRPAARAVAGDLSAPARRRRK